MPLLQTHRVFAMARGTWHVIHEMVRPIADQHHIFIGLPEMNDFEYSTSFDLLIPYRDHLAYFAH